MRQQDPSIAPGLHYTSSAGLKASGVIHATQGDQRRFGAICGRSTPISAIEAKNSPMPLFAVVAAPSPLVAVRKISLQDADGCGNERNGQTLGKVALLR